VVVEIRALYIAANWGGVTPLAVFIRAGVISLPVILRLDWRIQFIDLETNREVTE